MDFVIQWLWYLLAFVVGALVAWLITVVTIKPTSEEEALAELPGARELGAAVMQNVNWWLMVLAFVLGLVLTLALMIRRVKREVPEYGPRCRSGGRGCGSRRCGGCGEAGRRRPRGCRRGRTVRRRFDPGGGHRHRTGRWLHGEGQRGLDALSHDRQSVVQADDRRGLVPRRGDRREARASPAGTAASRSAD